MLQLFIYRHIKFAQFRYYCKKRNIDYYEVLQISPTSSQKEIRAAFIKLSKAKHPDVSGSKNHEAFTRINEAYNVLSKPHSRTLYDNSMMNNNLNIYRNNVSRRMNNPYYTTDYWSQYKSERYQHQTHNYWEDEYDYAYRDNRTDEEKQKSNVRQGLMVGLFFIGTVIIFTTQIVMVNRSVTRQREELKNYMTTLRQRREEAFKPENQDRYEDYVRQELMITPETSLQNQQNEALLNEKPPRQK